MITHLNKTLVIVLSKDFIITSINEEGLHFFNQINCNHLIGHSLFAMAAELTTLAHPIWGTIHSFLLSSNQQGEMAAEYQLEQNRLSLRMMSILHGYILLVDIHTQPAAHFFPTTLNQKLFFNSKQPLALVDPYGHVLNANPAWCDFFSLPTEPNFHTKTHLIHQFFLEFNAEMWQNYCHHQTALSAPQKEHLITQQGQEVLLEKTCYEENHFKVFLVCIERLFNQTPFLPKTLSIYDRFFHMPYVMHLLVEPETLLIADVNEASCLFYEKTAADIKGKMLSQFMHFEHFDLTVESQLLEASCLVNHNAFQLAVYWHHFLLLDKNYIFLRFHNISAQKSQLQTLQNLTDDVTFLQQKLPIGIWELNLSTNQMQWDKNVYYLYGLNEVEHLVSQPTLDFWLRFIHPRDLQRIEKHLTQAIQEQNQFDEIFQIILHDKSIRVVHVYAQPVQRLGSMRGMILDISREYFAKKALEENETLCYATCNHAPVGILRLQINGKIIQLNQAFLQLVNFPYDALIRKNLDELIHPDDRALNQRQYYGLVHQEITQYQIELRLITHSEQLIWVNLAVSPYYTNERILKFTICMVQDITTQKMAQIALYESQNQLARIMEGSSEGFWDWEINTGVFKFNHYWCEMLGYHYNDIQHQIDVWFDLIHPDDLKKVQNLLSQHLTGKNDLYECELRARSKKGEWVWVMDRGKVTSYDAENKPLLMSGTRKNIHQRKQAEWKLEEERQLFIGGPVVVFKWFPHNCWKVEYVSPNVPTQWGYPIDFFFTDTFSFAELIHPEDFQRITDEVDYYSHSTNTDYLEQEYRIRYADGSYHWQYDFTSILRTSENQVYLYYGYLLDIESRKQNEQELFLVNEQLLKTLSDLKKHDYEMTLLYHMNESLQACESLEKAYHVIASFCTQLFPNLNGRVAAYNQNNELEDVAIWGENCCCAAYFDAGCQSLVPKREQVITFDVPVKYSSLLQCDHVKQAERLQSFCMPLLMNGEALGIFHLSTQNQTQCLENTTRQLATAVTEAIKLSLSNIKLRQQLHDQAIRDALTGLFNRRYLDSILPVQLNAALRFQQKLALVLLDADFFKRFNDNYGHEAGDLVLQKIAEILITETKTHDIACRYGGEEMVLILTETTLEKAYEHVAMICQEIKEVSLFFHQEYLPKITVSAGIALFPDHANTADSLLRASDLALYDAKNSGRDCIKIFQLDKDYS